MRLLDKKRELLAMERLRYPSGWLSTYPRVLCGSVRDICLHLTIKARRPGRGHHIVIPGKSFLGFESKGNRFPFSVQ